MLTKNTQHCWMLVTCCVHLHTLLHVVSTLLGQQCWELLTFPSPSRGCIRLTCPHSSIIVCRQLWISRRRLAWHVSVVGERGKETQGVLFFLLTTMRHKLLKRDETDVCFFFLRSSFISYPWVCTQICKCIIYINVMLINIVWALIFMDFLRKPV